MREIDATTYKIKLIQVMSSETGQPATVTSPELLDGAGHRITRSGTGQLAGQPYNFKFEAYEEETFPNWFVSEPTIVVPPDPEEEEEE